MMTYFSQSYWHEKKINLTFKDKELHIHEFRLGYLARFYQKQPQIKK